MNLNRSIPAKKYEIYSTLWFFRLSSILAVKVMGYGWWIVVFFGCIHYVTAVVQATESITIYAPSALSTPWGAGPAIQQAFENKYHCKIRWVSFNGAASMLHRLRMEGLHTEADVVLGLDNDLLGLARSSALFAPPLLPTVSLTLPGGWSDPLFIPYSYSYLTFIYNHNNIINPPSSLRDLVESPTSWKIIYADPRSSSLGFQFLHWMNGCYGLAIIDAWQQLAKKTVTVTPDWSSAYGLFLQGEADFVLSYNTSLAYHNQQCVEHPYRSTILQEGHPLQIEFAAKIANSRQSTLSDHFIQFMLTPMVQQLLSEQHWVYPVTAIPLPVAFNNLIKPPALLTNSIEITVADRQLWIQTWRCSAVNR